VIILLYLFSWFFKFRIDILQRNVVWYRASIRAVSIYLICQTQIRCCHYWHIKMWQQNLWLEILILFSVFYIVIELGIISNISSLFNREQHLWREEVRWEEADESHGVKKELGKRDKAVSGHHTGEKVWKKLSERSESRV